MWLELSTKLSCSPEAAWRDVQTPALFHYITLPMAIVRVAKGSPFPAQWQVGEPYYCDPWLFGFIPTGRRRLISRRSTQTGAISRPMRKTAS